MYGAAAGGSGSARLTIRCRGVEAQVEYIGHPEG